MPRHIEHIDAIARKKGRTVLYLEFHPQPFKKWRDYLGQVYIDVTYDENLPRYRTLRDYLEYPNGSIRHDGVRFYAMSLDHAMKNAEHDEPGFWERWAEGF